MSADALNYGEYEMREYFKSHPYASNQQLQDYWIQQADATLKSTSYGQGAVTKTPPLNPAQTIPLVPYLAC
ncbi:MAG: hypothetical protein M3139_10440 [Bacteroidota bacterium]|nr:hypothetical protein [Bacteroidota bacterium]